MTTLTNDERLARLERIVIAAIDDAMNHGLLRFDAPTQALVNQLRADVANPPAGGASPGAKAGPEPLFDAPDY